MEGLERKVWNGRSGKEGLKWKLRRKNRTNNSVMKKNPGMSLYRKGKAEGLNDGKGNSGTYGLEWKSQRK